MSERTNVRHNVITSYSGVDVEGRADWQNILLDIFGFAETEVTIFGRFYANGILENIQTNPSLLEGRGLCYEFGKFPAVKETPKGYQR